MGLFVFCSLYRNEYLIFQKIIKLEYEFPEKFFPKAKDLVEQLLVRMLTPVLSYRFHYVAFFLTAFSVSLPVVGSCKEDWL